MKNNERNTEMNTIKHTVQQNQFQIKNPLKQKLNKGNTTHQQKQGKWATLTYFGKTTHSTTGYNQHINKTLAYKYSNNGMII
jgi:hypothetical protein